MMFLALLSLSALCHGRNLKILRIRLDVKNILVGFFFSIILCAYLPHVMSASVSSDTSCVRRLCGNPQLPRVRNSSYYDPIVTKAGKQLFTPSPDVIPPLDREVSITVFSVWVGLVPLRVNDLNHKKYCDFMGYEYQHFYYNSSDLSFPTRLFDKPVSGWATVMALLELLESSTADYFFKVDLDCLFVTNRVRIESMIDPYEQYSIYISTLSPNARFSSSHSWFVKNSQITRYFAEYWWSFHNNGHCNDLAMEQGAYSFAIGKMVAEYYGPTFSYFDCPNRCHTKRTPFAHYHCYLDWLEDNFGPGQGQKILHPDVFVYEATGQIKSPDVSFTFGIDSDVRTMEMVMEYSDALTIHPCKYTPYVSVEAALVSCMIPNEQAHSMKIPAKYAVQMKP